MAKKKKNPCKKTHERNRESLFVEGEREREMERIKP
jgi:hypothetical protein